MRCQEAMTPSPLQFVIFGAVVFGSIPVTLTSVEVAPLCQNPTWKNILLPSKEEIYAGFKLSNKVNLTTIISPYSIYKTVQTVF